MPALIDRTGMKYGRLTVIKRGPDYISPQGQKAVRWYCKCNCGNLELVLTTGNALQRGDSKSCGCLNTENRREIGKRNKRDKVGNQYGLLTVIRDTGKRTSTHEVIWLCKCKCGRYTQVKTGNLQSGNTISCGICGASKGELCIATWLEQHSILYVAQKTFEDCYNPKTSYPLFFDFYLPDIDLLIEYDGEQHYHITSGWNNTEALKENQYRDSIKNQYCQKMGIKLWRIHYQREQQDLIALLDKVLGKYAKNIDHDNS